MRVGDEEKNYRSIINFSKFINFEVKIKETDIFIRARKDLMEEARESILKYRKDIEKYIALFPDFRSTLVPREVNKSAPKIVKNMAKAAMLAKVGPMAAIAGAISEFVGRELLKISQDIILENGGDIFIKSSSELSIAIFAGKSPLSLKLGLKILPQDTPIGVCTSSGTVGPSLSYGKADAVTVIAKSVSLADAVATSIGNIIHTAQDIKKGLDFAQTIRGVMGVSIIIEDYLGTWGKVRLVSY